MAKILLKNIKGLVGTWPEETLVVKGSQMHALPVIENAWLAVENGVIVEMGEMKDWPGIVDWRDLEVIDCEGRYVLPAWVDSHSHLVFAGTREGEFRDRIMGLGYEEIAAKGGGILNSARKLQGMEEAELLDAALQRAEAVMKMGTGAIEIKSGYGLTPEAELKMLRVARKVGEQSPLDVSTSFLGAHAYPLEFKDNHEGYIDQIIDDMLPKIVDEGLADYIDVFCERGYFSADDTDRILEAGAKHGLKAKIHVNQFSSCGGIEVATKHKAVSVDHLEVMTDSDIATLAGSKTIATLLPSCSLFLSIPYAPARELIDADIPVALATDYNPGSTPSGNMNLVAALASIKMNMTPEEAITAATINGAAALEKADRYGSIAIGKEARILITKPIPSLTYLMYSFGEMLVERVML